MTSPLSDLTLLIFLAPEELQDLPELLEITFSPLAQETLATPSMRGFTLEMFFKGNPVDDPPPETMPLFVEDPVEVGTSDVTPFPINPCDTRMLPFHVRIFAPEDQEHEPDFELSEIKEYPGRPPTPLSDRILRTLSLKTKPQEGRHSQEDRWSMFRWMSANNSKHITVDDHKDDVSETASETSSMEDSEDGQVYGYGKGDFITEIPANLQEKIWKPFWEGKAHLPVHGQDCHCDAPHISKEGSTIYVESRAEALAIINNCGDTHKKTPTVRFADPPTLPRSQSSQPAPYSLKEERPKITVSRSRSFKAFMAWKKTPKANNGVDDKGFNDGSPEKVKKSLEKAAEEVAEEPAKTPPGKSKDDGPKQPKLKRSMTWPKVSWGTKLKQKAADNMSSPNSPTTKSPRSRPELFFAFRSPKLSRDPKPPTTMSSDSDSEPPEDQVPQDHVAPESCEVASSLVLNTDDPRENWPIKWFDLEGLSLEESTNKKSGTEDSTEANQNKAETSSTISGNKSSIHDSDDEDSPESPTTKKRTRSNSSSSSSVPANFPLDFLWVLKKPKGRKSKRAKRAQRAKRAKKEKTSMKQNNLENSQESKKPNKKGWLRGFLEGSKFQAAWAKNYSTAKPAKEKEDRTLVKPAGAIFIPSKGISLYGLEQGVKRNKPTKGTEQAQEWVDFLKDKRLTGPWSQQLQTHEQDAYRWLQEGDPWGELARDIVRASMAYAFAQPGNDSSVQPGNDSSEDHEMAEPEEYDSDTQDWSPYDQPVLNDDSSNGLQAGQSEETNESEENPEWEDLPPEHWDDYLYD